MKDPTDFLYQHKDTIGLLYPVSNEARGWIDTHIYPDSQRFGRGLVIE